MFDGSRFSYFPSPNLKSQIATSSSHVTWFYPVFLNCSYVSRYRVLANAVHYGTVCIYPFSKMPIWHLRICRQSDHPHDLPEGLDSFCPPYKSSRCGRILRPQNTSNCSLPYRSILYHRKPSGLDELSLKPYKLPISGTWYNPPPRMYHGQNIGCRPDILTAYGVKSGGSL